MIRKRIIPIALILLAFSLVLFGVFAERLEPVTKYLNNIVYTSMRPKADNLKGIAVHYRSHKQGSIQAINGNELIMTFAHGEARTEIWTLGDYVYLETPEASASSKRNSDEVLTRSEALMRLKAGQNITIAGIPANQNTPGIATYIVVHLNGGLNISGKMDDGRNETVVVPQDAKDPTNSNKPYPSYLYRIQKSPW